jgi:ABC-2 type transport system ATP-binding protein
LDEPLNGIDPGGRREINHLLMRLAERGKTIVISSHILVEVEGLADTILMISAGRIVASGTLADIRTLIEDQPFSVEIATPQPRQLASLLVKTPDVRSVDLRDEFLLVRTRNPGQFFALLSDLVLQHGVDVDRFEVIDAGADAVFNYLQQGSR